jgi:hypothetical protein
MRLGRSQAHQNLECGSLLPPWSREASFARESASKLAHSKESAIFGTGEKMMNWSISSLVVCTTIASFALSLAGQSEINTGRYLPPKPDLEFMARFEVNLDAPVLEVGQVEGAGKRRIIPITGGKFSGPRLKGQILNNGADWQLVQSDGLARLDTRYALKTDDGALIYIQTRGVRHGPADVIAEVAKGSLVDPNKYFFRVFVQFETGSAQYAWLNRAMAIGSGMRLRNAVVYDAYLIK